MSEPFTPEDRQRIGCRDRGLPSEQGGRFVSAPAARLASRRYEATCQQLESELAAVTAERELYRDAARRLYGLACERNYPDHPAMVDYRELIDGKRGRIRMPGDSDGE